MTTHMKNNKIELKGFESHNKKYNVDYMDNVSSDFFHNSKTKEFTCSW